MKTSLHGFMKAGLLDYDTKVREQWVGCHPGQVRGIRILVVIFCSSSRDKSLIRSTLHEYRPRKRRPNDLREGLRPMVD